MIVLNFKTYAEVTMGDNALDLARIAQDVHDTYNVDIVLCVQAPDLYKVSRAVSIPVYAQHIDPIDPGKNTGFISPLAIKENGSSGVLINHSEHRIGMEMIEKTIAAAKEYDLKTIVCVENAEEAVEVDIFGPDAIALEDPVLIGGSESIVKNEAGKQKVIEFVAKNLNALPLVGAGVKDQPDVRESLNLGARGVLLASGFDLADDPRAVLQDLCEGYAL